MNDNNEDRLESLILFACGFFLWIGTKDVMYYISPSGLDDNLRMWFAAGKAALIDATIIYLTFQMGKRLTSSAWLMNLGAAVILLALSFVVQGIDAAIVRDMYDTLPSYAKTTLDWILPGAPAMMILIVLMSKAFNNQRASGQQVAKQKGRVELLTDNLFSKVNSMIAMPKGGKPAESPKLEPSKPVTQAAEAVLPLETIKPK